jgi:hypothetical protein
MKYDCAVIQDLIPLYQDGSVSPRTHEIVAEHLRECPVCRDFADRANLPPAPDPRSAPPQNPEIVRYGQRVRSRRRKIALIIGAVLLILLLIIAALGIFTYKLIMGDPPTVHRDIAEYGQFGDYKRYSNLKIFPAALPSSARDSQYYYFFQDTFLDPSYQIYLEYTLSAEDYQAEVQRLSQITTTRNNETHRIVYDPTHFPDPAYVTVDAHNLTYEYALLIEKQYKIVYIYSQWMHRKDLGFDPRYLPADFQWPGDPDVDTLGGYNIYYFELGDGIWAREDE